jgi:hypothetical protein
MIVLINTHLLGKDSFFTLLSGAGIIRSGLKGTVRSVLALVIKESK